MTNTQQLNDALAANYLLVSMALRSWSGKRTDRTASNELIASKQASADSGAFVKNLLASASGELKLVHQLGNSLRQFVYTNTLPWNASSDGAMRGERLLATSKSLDFLRDLNAIKKEYDAAVMALVAVWPNRVAEAMRNLGQLANQSDYPGASELPQMFSMVVDLRPVPSVSDFARLNVPANLAQALGDRHIQQAEVQVENAMRELRERLTTELERIATQLGKHANGEKTRLYDSLVTNMQGVVDLARNMNVRENPKLAELADRIEHQLLQMPVDAYRNSTEKAKVASEAAKALALDAALDEVWQ